MEPRALVALSYAELCEPEADLSTQIEAAFGPDGLGIVVVNDVPEYATLRATLLPLASRLAALPREELAALEDAESTWNFGWSHGKERLESGRNGAAHAACLLVWVQLRRRPSRAALFSPSCGGTARRSCCAAFSTSRTCCADTAKGSFYANPLLDAPTDDPELVKRCVQVSEAAPRVPAEQPPTAGFRTIAARTCGRQSRCRSWKVHSKRAERSSFASACCSPRTATRTCEHEAELPPLHSCARPSPTRGALLSWWGGNNVALCSHA